MAANPIELTERWKEHNWLGITAFLSCMQELCKEDRVDIFAAIVTKRIGCNIAGKLDPLDFFEVLLTKHKVLDWPESQRNEIQIIDEACAKAVTKWHRKVTRH